MQLIDWNIQWGRDADGGVDLSRTVAAIRALGDFDVLCLQEVTRGFGALPGRPGADQFAELAALLPGYTIIDAIGADLPPIETGAPRRQFGNAIATRLPVGRVLRQLLPWPADAGAPSMPRVALDVELQTSFGPLRVVTTHLEYYSAHQRLGSTHCATGTARPARAWHDRRPPKTQRGRSAQPASHAMRSSAATSTARSAATPIADSWSRSRTRRASSTHGSLDTADATADGGCLRYGAMVGGAARVRLRVRDRYAAAARHALRNRRRRARVRSPAGAARTGMIAPPAAAHLARAKRRNRPGIRPAGSTPSCERPSGRRASSLEVQPRRFQ